MKRKIFFFNNTCSPKFIHLYSTTNINNKYDDLDIDLNIEIDKHSDSKITIETENVLFFTVLNKSHIYKLDMFTNSISFENDIIKFFTIPGINYL